MTIKKKGLFYFFKRWWKTRKYITSENEQIHAYAEYLRKRFPKQKPVILTDYEMEWLELEQQRIKDSIEATERSKCTIMVTPSTSTSGSPLE